MNSADRLKAIIAERKEWEAFGWAPLLAAWGVLLVVRTTVELVTGPRAEWGTLAYGAALGAQAFVAWRSPSGSGPRQGSMHGLWALLAVVACFLGSWAPVLGFLPGLGASVLELLFLAGGLVTCGILKTRPSLVVGGVGLAAVSVLVGGFPFLWAWRPLFLAATFGIPAAVTWVHDRD